MLGQTQAPHFIDGLYEKLIEGGVGYFFPSAKFESIGRDTASPQERVTSGSDGRSVTMNWLGSRCSLTRDEPFSDSEIRLLTSIGAVLGARYRMIQAADRVEQRFELFRGLPEDRYVSAYVHQRHITNWCGRGRIASKMRLRSCARLP